MARRLSPFTKAYRSQRKAATRAVRNFSKARARLGRSASKALSRAPGQARKAATRAVKSAAKAGSRAYRSQRKVATRAAKGAVRAGTRASRQARTAGNRLGRQIAKSTRRGARRAIKRGSALATKGVQAGLQASGLAGPSRDSNGKFRNTRGSRASITTRESPAYALIRRMLWAGTPGFGVTVGVHGREGSQPHMDGKAKGQTIAEIASEHELGLGVPERSFIRAYCDANAVQISNDLRQASKKILSGRLRSDQAANLIGMKHAAGIQKFIADGRVTPPLSEYTIAKKGSSTPLIDTGQLRSAITYAVQRLLA